MTDRNAENNGGQVDASVPPIEWGVAARPILGQVASGDQHLVKPLATGVLVGAVDGLGHGPEAATAARIAVATLEACADQGLVSLVQVCHERLRGTRGVAMTLAAIDAQDNTLTWLAVGNVEGVLLRVQPGGLPLPSAAPPRESEASSGRRQDQRTAQASHATATGTGQAREWVVLRGGVVGHQLPSLRTSILSISPGDILILATDGIGHGFADGLNLGDPPQAIAVRILATHGKSTDDALVLVVRYRGCQR